MATQPASPLNEEEYLCIEREAATKSEFHDGRMFAMAGSSLNHALLSNTIGSILRGQVPPGCRTVSSDLRIKVAAAGLYTYADCSVICGDPQFAGSPKESVLNPLLIVEVLSPSTEGYDRGKKFEMYRTIESFREYLIVHQDSRHVEHYSKQDGGGWLLREHTGDGFVNIPHLGVTISLAELYAGVMDLT